VEYLDCLLSSYIVATDKLKQTLQYVYLIDGADEPMLPFLRQRVSLKLYELCYLNPSNIQDILGSDCNIYYEKAKNDFSVSLKYTPENPVSPDLITSQIKIRLFQLGIPQSFLYFNVNQENLETYKIVFKESYQQLRDMEILYAKENIFNNYFYLFLLGYISEFNNNLAEAKEFYEQYLSILQNKSILDDQEQQMMGTAFYRLARVNIIIDEDLYLRQISDNLEHPNLFKSFETAKTQFSNIISQENIFLNQNIANQLLKY
jgi:hypothetical protein